MSEVRDGVREMVGYRCLVLANIIDMPLCKISFVSLWLNLEKNQGVKGLNKRAN